VESPSDGRYRPSCMMAHRLINQMAVIVGYCDLLAQDEPENQDRSKRLLRMREIASAAAEELSQHECELESIMWSVSTEVPTPSRRT
jgi:hypothetical protein